MSEDFKVVQNANSTDFTVVSNFTAEQLATIPTLYDVVQVDWGEMVSVEEIQSAIDYAFSAAGAADPGQYAVDHIPVPDANLSLDCTGKFVSGSTIMSAKRQLADMGHRLGYLSRMSDTELLTASIESLIEEIERAR